MPSASPPISPSVRDLLHEKFDALLDECDLVMETAEYGRTFHDLDDFFCTKGHNLLQEVFLQKLQERITNAEKTAEAKHCPDCKKKTIYQNKKTKTLAATHGHVTLHRNYRYCSDCEQYSYPIEVTLGLETGYTERLTRIITRCVGLWSYRLSAETIEELCGVQLSHMTLGKIADATAVKLGVKLENNSDIREAFQKAKGDTEFYADGVFAHIRDEYGVAKWMEFKIGALVKRPRGLFALPSEWGGRKLPEPTAVAAFAAIVDKEEFQELCQKMRRTLGVGGVSSALGDGAKWIWNIVRDVFGKTDECLDIYHGAEHISDCGKVLFESASERTEWFERMRLVLLSEGFAGMERELKLLSGTLKEKEQAAVDLLLEYLRNNEGRLNYAERLAQGRSIGSGLIEGACKNLIGKRLKQTGACWRVQRANRIALISGILYSDQWKLCWKNAN
jgi:hypothetical protein